MMIYFPLQHIHMSTPRGTEWATKTMRVPPSCSFLNFVEDHMRVCEFPPSLVTCT